MNRQWKSIIALACFLFGVGTTTAQENTRDHRNDIFVQLEILDMHDGLPGAGSKRISPVGGPFGLNTTRETDMSGKQVYFRTIDGRSGWGQSNEIEVTLEINENGEKRTETIWLDNFEPKTLILREDQALGWRELLRVIPVWDPTKRDQNAVIGK
jgi:hypothetical protein